MWGNMLRATVVVRCRAEGRIQISISRPVFFVLPHAVFHFYA